MATAAFLWLALPRAPDPAGACPSCGSFVLRAKYGFGTSGYAAGVVHNDGATYERRRLGYDIWLEG